MKPYRSLAKAKGHAKPNSPNAILSLTRFTVRAPSQSRPPIDGHVSPHAQGSGYTTRAISQNWTGVRQYGQIFMFNVQRSHAS
jgi:hypothetical protein